jgi:hypothetical protein
MNPDCAFHLEITQPFKSPFALKYAANAKLKMQRMAS